MNESADSPRNARQLDRSQPRWAMQMMSWHPRPHTYEIYAGRMRYQHKCWEYSIAKWGKRWPGTIQIDRRVSGDRELFRTGMNRFARSPQKAAQRFTFGSLAAIVATADSYRKQTPDPRSPIPIPNPRFTPRLARQPRLRINILWSSWITDFRSRNTLGQSFAAPDT